MVPKKDPGTERAIEILREIQELCRIDVARSIGGAISQATLRVISYWIARAWEAGVDYQKSRNRKDE